MVLRLWLIRRDDEEFDPAVVYGDNPTIFSLKVHHGGRLTQSPGKIYMGGKINFIDMIDSDLFSVIEVNAIMEELGYLEEEEIFYYYRIPNHDLDVVHKLISKADGPLTPNATKALNTIKSDASQYTVIWNTKNKYQVSGPWLDQVVVDIDQKTCSCRRWELTGIPCRHAVAVNWNMAQYGAEVGVPESWVSKVYWLDTWKKVYDNTVDPVQGRDMWTRSTCPTTLTPPKHHKQIGRPKKKRKKTIDELNQGVAKNGKLARAGNTVTCGVCKGQGHNSRSCKG